jgi:hypothetical protein
MSISQLNNSVQTGLVPNSLLGYSSNGVSAIEITPTSITIAGDLNTATPIYVGISASTGLTTTLATGLDVNCDFNMNGNDITNVASIITSGSNIDINAQTDAINLQSTTGMSLSVNNGALNLTSSGAGITLSTDQQIDMTATGSNITLNTPNGDLIINGSNYPPVVPADTLEAVLTAGNIAYDKDLILRMTGTSVGDTGLILINDDTSPTETTKLYATLVQYDDSFTTYSTNWLSIINSANAGTPNLQQVLDSGATATSSLTLNNNGIGNNFINLIPNATANNPNITLTDGTTTNTIDKNGYTTRNSVQNATHYINFSDNSATGIGAIQKTAGLSCNPSTNTITATSFVGNLSGTSSSSSAITLLTDNTSGTYYIPFSKNVAGSQRTLYVDDTSGPLTYNPSTGNMSATSYTITGTPSTASVASTFGQVGLVYLSTSQFSIVGSASAQTISVASIFNSTYQNYRIVLNSATQVSFTQYPTYSLAGYLGTGVPTTGSLYGNELTSASSSSIVAVYTAGATLSSSPLLFAVSSLTNKQVVFEVENVGFANTAANVVGLKCKSFYGNPGVSGYSDRNIVSSSLNGATITGLTIQQSSLGVGNNMTLQAIVYGYNTI